MAPPMAFVDLHDAEEFDPPHISAEVDPTGESETFESNLAAALEWARARSARIAVRVRGKAWSAGSVPFDDLPQLEPTDMVRAVAALQREFERFEAERATYDDNRRWYHAVLDPDVEGALAEAEDRVRAIPEVDALRRRTAVGGEVVWIVEVLARSRDEAERVNRRITDVLWSPERIRRTYPDGVFYIGTGQSATGLVDFVEDCWVLQVR